MNVPAREGHQGPEDRGEHGWEALAYELGHWDCWELLAVTCIEILAQTVIHSQSCPTIKSIVVFSMALAPCVVAAPPASTNPCARASRLSGEVSSA